MVRALKPILVTPPAVELVTLAEAKAHLRADHCDEDTYIVGLIQAVSSRLSGWDGILGRALVNSTWRFGFDGFPAENRLRLPMGPLRSVSSIIYRDQADQEQTLGAGFWWAVEDHLGPAVVRRPSAPWPTTADRPDAVQVTAVIGCGPAASDVPATIRHAALLMVGELYMNRSSVDGDLPPGVARMLAAYTVKA